MAEQYVIAEEIHEDSILKFYDIRRPDTILFEIRSHPAKLRGYAITQFTNNQLTGEIESRIIKEVRDQLDAIRILNAFFAREPLGMIGSFDIINP